MTIFFTFTFGSAFFTFFWCGLAYACVCVYVNSYGMGGFIHITQPIHIAVIFIFCCSSFCWHNHDSDTHTLPRNCTWYFISSYSSFCFSFFFTYTCFKPTLYAMNVVLIIKHCNCVLPQQQHTHLHWPLWRNTYLLWWLHFFDIKSDFIVHKIVAIAKCPHRNSLFVHQINLFRWFVHSFGRFVDDEESSFLAQCPLCASQRIYYVWWP